MNTLRVGTALSAVAMAAVLTGCATGHQSRESVFGSNVANSSIGLATRAEMALTSGDAATAVSLAERAVESNPSEASYRMVLGNCYFGAGRFASAETAYEDSLTLLPNQPKVILKLALVQIAQGKDHEALGYLELARSALNPADYGLAIALAGRADDAVAILNQAARQPGADARVRQNLALAYGLSGDWTMARTVAAQDVAPSQLDNRIQKWMQMATPEHPSDQLAAITGIHPAADPGQPQGLALKAPNPLERYAQAAAVQQQQAQATPAPAQQPLPVAMAEPMPVAQPAPEPVEVPHAVVAEAARSLIEATPAADPKLPTSFDMAGQQSTVEAVTDPVRKAAATVLADGDSNSVVQIGAYSSPDRVEVAWDELSRRYPSLAQYRPVSARFNSGKRTFYRLAVKGFDSTGQAKDLCSSLQDKGKSCFVRHTAGDAPIQYAAR